VDISAAPGWVVSDHFDLEATFTPPATPEQVSQMLQNLLADRFKLVVRREMRRERGYSMVVARGDGTLGPALKPARDPGCVRGTPTASGGPPCGQVQFGPGRVAGTSVRWMQLVIALASPGAAGAPIDNGAGEREGPTTSNCGGGHSPAARDRALTRPQRPTCRIRSSPPRRNNSG
jgi:uncharacterized protein (TIGR03435 family)